MHSTTQENPTGQASALPVQLFAAAQAMVQTFPAQPPVHAAGQAPPGATGSGPQPVPDEEALVDDDVLVDEEVVEVVDEVVDEALVEDAVEVAEEALVDDEVDAPDDVLVDEVEDPVELALVCPELLEEPVRPELLDAAEPPIPPPPVP